MESVKKEGKFLEMIIISHKGSFYMIWANLMVFLYIGTSFLYAQFAAFRGKDISRLQENYFEIVFTFDLLMRFNLDFP